MVSSETMKATSKESSNRTTEDILCVTGHEETLDADLREAAADIHGRFLRAEAWLDCHDEAHPQWDTALDRLNAAILGMVSIEQEARQRGIEKIFENLAQND